MDKLILRGIQICILLIIVLFFIQMFGCIEKPIKTFELEQNEKKVIVFEGLETSVGGGLTVNLQTPVNDSWLEFDTNRTFNYTYVWSENNRENYSILQIWNSSGIIISETYNTTSLDRDNNNSFTIFLNQSTFPKDTYQWNVLINSYNYSLLYCYQGLANVSNACGGTENGSYLFTYTGVGNWTNESFAYDENFTTFAVANISEIQNNNQNYTFYFNYSLPNMSNFLLNNSILTTKAGTPTNRNWTIGQKYVFPTFSDGQIGIVDNKVLFAINITPFSAFQDKFEYLIWNGTDWRFLFFTFENYAGGNSGKVFEVAMNWAYENQSAIQFFNYSAVNYTFNMFNGSIGVSNPFGASSFSWNCSKITEYNTIIEPDNQNSTLGFWNITNNGDEAINISLSLSSQPTTLIVYVNSSANSTLKQISNNSNVTVLQNLAVNASALVWEYVNCTESAISGQYSVSHIFNSERR